MAKPDLEFIGSNNASFVGTRASRPGDMRVTISMFSEQEGCRPMRPWLHRWTLAGISAVRSPDVSDSVVEGHSFGNMPQD
jgi:hypothetical protein